MPDLHCAALFHHMIKSPWHWNSDTDLSPPSTQQWHFRLPNSSRRFHLFPIRKCVCAFPGIDISKNGLHPHTGGFYIIKCFLFLHIIWAKGFLSVIFRASQHVASEYIPSFLKPVWNHRIKYLIVSYNSPVTVTILGILLPVGPILPSAKRWKIDCASNSPGFKRRNRGRLGERRRRKRKGRGRSSRTRRRMKKFLLSVGM